MSTKRKRDDATDAPDEEVQRLARDLGINLDAKPRFAPKAPHGHGGAQAPSPIAQFNASLPGILPCPFPEPVPFEPPAERPYPEDTQDELMPEPGFVTDFAYSMKGKESPAVFNIFAALFALAVVASRKVSFKWALGDFFPNLYVLFVAPPAICTKSAALERAHALVQELPSFLLSVGDPILAEEKRVDAITGSATPGGIMRAMAAHDGMFILPDGSIHVEHYGSKAYVWNDEIVTLLNNQRFTEGLTNALTKWYDCRKSDSETFKSSDAPPLKDIYFNLAGALTPMHVQRSLPEEAFLGGFMSRVILVSQATPANFFPEPIDYDGFPSTRDLLERLAWISYNARGSYDFTDEARDFYRSFYVETKSAYIVAQGDSAMNTARARHVHLTIRLALLLRMSEYRPGNDVTLRNLKDAIALLEYTYASARPVTSMIGATPLKKNYTRMRRYIRTQGLVTRSKLLRRMGRSACLKDEVNSLLAQLKQEGLVAFYLNGNERQGQFPSTLGAEVYMWTGTKEDTDEDDTE